MKGQSLLNGQLTYTNNTIDMSNLSQGVYFLKLISDQGSIVKKIIKE